MSQAKSKYEELPKVLAMINEMIEESVYHTETFAHTLQAHHNNKAAEVFLHACEQFNAEQQIVMRDVKGTELPNLPPWEILYPEYIHPSSLLSEAHYLMNEDEAWEIVDTMVKIHQGFYIFLSKESRTDSVFSLVDQLVKYYEKCGKEDKAEIL